MKHSTSDKNAAQAADLRIDAEQGKRLIEVYQAKWHQEGYAAFLSGVSFDKLWNHAQRAGWTQAEAEREAAILEKLEKPGLDATPWQLPEELSEEYNAWLDEFLADWPQDDPAYAAWLEAGAPRIAVAGYVPFQQVPVSYGRLADQPGYDISTCPYLY